MCQSSDGIHTKTLLRLRVIVFLDFLGVAAVVPLLSSYFRALNVSVELFGLVTSAYSAAQIVGGVCLGALSDRVFSRRSMLLLSFAGSCISYGLIGLSSSLGLLLTSRIIVGLVKQTMTISTALISDHSEGTDRAKQLSQLSAAASFSFIVGPTIGSFLYKHNMMFPPLFSAAIFLLNSLLTLVLLPSERGVKEHAGDLKPQLKLDGFWTNLKFTCTRRPCLAIVLARLMHGFLFRSMAPQIFVGYMEERWKVESHVLGYMSSYTAVVGLLVQVYVVGRILDKASEKKLVPLAIAGKAISGLMEAWLPFGLPFHLSVTLPLSVTCGSMLMTLLSSIFLKRVHKDDVGAALGALNVMQSVVGILGPLYGGLLFKHMGVLKRPLASGVHYALFLLLWVGLEQWCAGDKTCTEEEGGDELAPADADALNERVQVCTLAATMPPMKAFHESAWQ
ncbi:unnamed protein product [Chrysoparadoxa australica]